MMNKKELDLIKGIVNEVVAENNKVLLAKMESMEKQIKALSVDNAVVVKESAPKSKSTKSTKKSTTTKAQAGVKQVSSTMAENLGYDVVQYDGSFYLRQTTFQKNRKYREAAMKNEGRFRTDEGFEKMKCYEFKTKAKVDEALKSVKKMIDDYKKSVAK